MTTSYILTNTAERDFYDAKTWSLERWGSDLTKAYFQDLHETAENIAKYQSRYKSRDDLAGGTGLCVRAVREHYLIYISMNEK